ncbi:MAG TPA: hypothetical protein VG406_08995 [Isosphaeraceae bacterium]|jgi:predicted transcriptional regulator|nr:hypothetical protein [Isosphaeraceae bacterium]
MARSPIPDLTIMTVKLSGDDRERLDRIADDLARDTGQPRSLTAAIRVLIRSYDPARAAPWKVET